MDKGKDFETGRSLDKKGNLCALVEDILPMYLDGLVSQKTGNTVKKHLQECESCRLKYQKMSQQLPVEEPMQEALNMSQPVPEIDYLKKVKNRGRRRMLSLALGLVLLFTVCLLWQRYGHGTATEAYTASVAVEGDVVKIEGEVQDGKAYADYAIREKDGVSYLSIYEAEPSFWHDKKSFAISIPLEKAKQDELVVSGQRISASGQLIEAKTRSIYANRHPYIGDAPKNGALAEMLGIAEELGNFSNQLQTEKEPYGWYFTFHNIMEGTVDELVLNDKMKGYACVLFACVDNLEEVGWYYMMKNEPAPEGKEKKCGTNEKQETFTSEEASKFLGQDVKSYGESEEKLQELLKLTGILPGSETTLSFSEEYPYRKVLTGTMKNAQSETTFVVLTRNKDVTFEQVSWSILSSNSNDWLEDTVIVDVY